METIKRVERREAAKTNISERREELNRTMKWELEKDKPKDKDRERNRNKDVVANGLSAR